MPAKKNGLSKEIRAAIDEAVKAGQTAGLLQAERAAQDTYKKTEQRLYALPILRTKLEADKERLDELEQYGPKEKSKSIVRFSRSGVRLSPDEMFEAQKQDLLATIASDEYEIHTVEIALDYVKNDPYWLVVEGKYLDKIGDNEIGLKICCDASTIRRNRGRLIRQIAIFLYGVQAIG